MACLRGLIRCRLTLHRICYEYLSVGMEAASWVSWVSWVLLSAVDKPPIFWDLEELHPPINRFCDLLLAERCWLSGAFVFEFHRIRN